MRRLFDLAADSTLRRKPPIKQAMGRLSRDVLEHPRQISAALSGVIALAVAVAQLVLGVELLLARRAELVEQAGTRLESIALAVGADADRATLSARLRELESSGITALRPATGRRPLYERNRELVYRGHGVEVRMSVDSINQSVRRSGLRQLGAGLLAIGAACAAAWLFVMRSRAIQAAERVDLYARRLEEQNEELSVAKQKAERADRSKTEFMANMSHELRTPLASILGFSDGLIERAEDRGGDDLEDARAIQRNGQYLYRLLTSLLDFSDLEAGRLAIDLMPCSPANLVKDVELSSRPDAEARGLRLRVEIAEEAPDIVTSDAVRIRQVLSLLVENAIKFTDEGSVTLRLSLLSKGFAQPHVAFDVIDTGVGMPESQLETLFESFSQGDGSRSRRHGGLGLGLALGRGVARELDGDITVVSTLEEGSAFRLALPLAPPGEEAELPPEPAPQPELAALDCRVLVAEDGADNRRLLERILGQLGADTSFVEDGGKAVIAAIEAWRAGEPFDVIYMDSQMPETDGLSATRSLRAEGYPGIIIALTADAREGNREECLQAGCDEFLTKPIARDALLAATLDLLKRKGPS